MSDEVWARHPVYADYDISTLGRVRRATPGKGTRVGRMKTLILSTTRYIVANIEGKPRKVHLLVLETFLGPRPPGQEGRHRDGDRTNNTLDNLQWGTRKENMADARRHGTDSRCERHPGAKLTWEQVCEIRKRVAGGELQKHVAPLFGVTPAHVSYIVNTGWNH